ncbi:MAG: PAS domain S-box protein [Kovacikia sp.]
MDISQQIEAVYQRVALLKQYAADSPVPKGLLEKAIQELYFVLEELQSSQEELQEQNQTLIATQQMVELERQRYQTLFDFAPNGYLVTDLQGNICYVNHHAASLLFYTSQEYLINKPLLLFIHEPDRPYFRVQLAQLTSGHPWEVTLSPRNDRLIPVSITAIQIQDPQRKKDMLLWSLHDITLYKQVECQLQGAHDGMEQQVMERTADLLQAYLRLQQEINERQQAEQKVRDQAAMIDITTDAFFVLNLDQQILFWSQGAEKVYGWDSAAILGKKAQILFPQDAVDQLAARFTQTVEQDSWQGELDQVNSAGKPIIVASRWTVVRHETGQILSILVSNTDITEKKQLEAQFFRSQRIESLGSVAVSVAHDLNNVLSPILSFAEMQLTRRSELDSQSHEIWECVKHSAQRGADLVQQITQFAHGTAGKREPMVVEVLLLEIAKSIQKTFPSAIKIVTDIPTQPLGLVAADPTQLYQVVINLCSNARNAMPNGGTLTLAIAEREVDAVQAQNHLPVHPGSYIMITVSDTGIGIPPALIERIFEPFFTAQESDQNTGLGLSTAFRIVQNHAGFIELFSQEGKGTQFQVYLPVIQAARDLSPEQPAPC